MISSLIVLLIKLCLVAGILAIVLWILSKFSIEPPFSKIVFALVCAVFGLIAILLILQVLGPLPELGQL